MLHVTMKFYLKISYHKRIAHQQRRSSKAKSMTIRSWSQKFRPVNIIVVSDAVWARNKIGMKKAHRERRKHCVLVVVRRSHKYSPRRRPPSSGAGRPKFYQLKKEDDNYMFTEKLSLVRIDARNFQLSW